MKTPLFVNTRQTPEIAFNIYKKRMRKIYTFETRSQLLNLDLIEFRSLRKHNQNDEQKPMFAKPIWNASTCYAPPASVSVIIKQIRLDKFHHQHFFKVASVQYNGLRPPAAWSPASNVPVCYIHSCLAYFLNLSSDPRGPVRWLLQGAKFHSKDLQT